MTLLCRVGRRRGFVLRFWNGEFDYNKKNGEYIKISLNRI